MKKFQVILVAVVAIALAAVPASAQFRFGPRLGLEVNSLHFSNVKDNLTSTNQAGFTGGVMAEFTVPLIGVGADVALMYVHRVNNATADNTSTKLKYDYLEIPLNVKYKFGLPVVGKVLSPYVFTGPSFAFLLNKDALTAAFESRSVDVSWNIGVGVQLFSHLQVGASYGLGISKAVKYIPIVNAVNGTPIEGKNNCWTVTAAWLF
ncbi:MAG: PorT family protein [Muribaculaceae bacterium]|nr:PorT family protein [Muribaculaceae bacterium]